MATRNPCCMPLKRGVAIMAVVEVLLSTLHLILLIVAVVKFSRENKDDDNDEEVAIWVSVFSLVRGIVGLFISVRLYKGATESNIGYCRLWLIFTTIMSGFVLIFLIVNGASGKYEAGSLVLNIMLFLYRLYMAYCVYCFIQELRAVQSGLAFQATMENGMVGVRPMPENGNPNWGQAYPHPPQPQQFRTPVNVVDGPGYGYSIRQDQQNQQVRQMQQQDDYL